MKILYYHQHFSTPGGSTGTRSYEMARKLIRRGHQVTVICGSFQSGNTGLTSPFTNGRREGMVDGIRIIELYLPYSNYDSLIRRSLTFFKFAAKSTLIAFRESYDVLFATSTPLTAGVPGIITVFFKRKPFVFEVRDLWPELPREMGVVRNPIVLKAMEILEWLSYHSARGCIGLSPGIVKGITRKNFPPNRVAMIPNGCDLDLFNRETGDSTRPEGVGKVDTLAVFCGAHGVANGLSAVLDAAAELKRRNRQDIKIAFIGDGKLKPSLLERARKENLSSCLFMDPVPKKELISYLRGADVGLMILADVPAFYFGTSPNKFFDYISIGLPVLNNYPGWLAEMISEHECGLAVPPENPSAFADALEKLADDPGMRKKMGENAMSLAKNQFDRDMLSGQFAKFLEGAYSGDLKNITCSGEYGRASSPSRSHPSSLQTTVKRIFDFSAVLLGMGLVWPLLLFLAFLVRMKLGSPVLFRQARPGMGGKPFVMHKFRTMTDTRDEYGNLLPDEKRLIRFGKLLRSLSLDELPELINVLKGEMSLVGPRPLLMQYLDRYTPEQARRHEAKPGVTGWAQINGRNAISWDEKFRLDVWYVDNQSFLLDMTILWKTVVSVFKREGISAAGEATMPEFMGTCNHQ